MKTFSSISFQFFFVLILLCAASSAQAGKVTDNTRTRFQFATLINEEWKDVFVDSCTSDWKEKWFLDGKKATIAHSKKGMDFAAGMKWGDDSCHAVLWTKKSFSGDIRIDFEYTRLDDEIRGVTILYILATGSGAGPYKKDISRWSDRRAVPSMKLYFLNMNTYHISYAAFGTKNKKPDEDYIRARRYLPRLKRLRGSELTPNYNRTGLFKKGVPHQITVIKKGRQLFMHIRTPDKEMLCHFKADRFPPITEGRIGLRHMYTRSARYSNFRISVLNEAAKKEKNVPSKP